MSAVCVGHFGSLAGAGWLLTVPGCWLARLKRLLVGRLGVCGDTLLILLVPFFFFFGAEMGFRQCGWEHAAIL